MIVGNDGLEQARDSFSEAWIRLTRVLDQAQVKAVPVKILNLAVDQVAVLGEEGFVEFGFHVEGSTVTV